jgi:hypothetical protein
VPVAEIPAVRPLNPYAPVVVQGWNRRPVGKAGAGETEPYFVTSEKDPTEFAEQLASAQHVAIPFVPSGQRMVVIYAWNEIAEGGILIPNVGERFEFLNKVKEVFP